MPARTKGKNKKLSENEENQNIINLKIVDSILDDNEKEFTNIILQKTIDKSNFDQTICLKDYKLPKILYSNPSITSFCAFFGAEKCINSYFTLFPDTLKNSKKSCTLLHFACAGGNLNILRELEQSNFDIDQRDSENLTPSCYAAMMDHLNVIKYLWTKGAKIISPSSNYLSPFHIACLYGNLEVAKFIYDTFLSDNFQNAKLLFQPNLKRNTTPLHLACEGGHSNIVKYLASMIDLFKIQANSYDGQLRTPVVIASQNGSLDCLKILSEENDVNFDVPKRKFLPLVEASANGHLDIVKFLLTRERSKIDINKTNTENVNAIQAAISHRHIEIVRFLISNGALQNYNKAQIGELMMNSILSLDLAIIKLLDKSCQVPYNEKVNQEDNESTTWGNQYMQQACLNENEEIANFLLNKKCTFDHVDLSENVKNDWSHFMDFLIENGVDLSQNPFDKIPLIVYTISTGKLQRIKKMIKMGAILNKEIISDFNCVYNTCKFKRLELFKFLMSYKPTIRNANAIINLCIIKTSDAQNKNDKKTADLYKFMIQQLLNTQEVDLNEGDDYNSLLSIAASNNCIDILELFEKKGADFVNCVLEIRKMTTDNFLPVLQFFKNRGCKFIQKSPILDSLLLDCQYQLNEKILVLLLDFISNDEILNFFNYCGNITDIAMRSDIPYALLLIFKKVNKVILPQNCTKEIFLSWISECNLPELKNFVSKSIDV